MLTSKCMSQAFSMLALTLMGSQRQLLNIFF